MVKKEVDITIEEDSPAEKIKKVKEVEVEERFGEIAGGKKSKTKKNRKRKLKINAEAQANMNSDLAQIAIAGGTKKRRKHKCKCKICGRSMKK